MMRIDVRRYLNVASTLTDREVNLQRELLDFLPPEIIDCHAHCNLPEHVGALDEGVVNHMMSTFPYFTLEQSANINMLHYPGKRIHTLRFANAYRGINHRAANDYLLKNSPPGDRMALYGIPDDIEYTIRALQDERVAGLKMYYQYFKPPATSIYQVFPPDILTAAQARDIPIILHLPRMITKCGTDLEQMLGDFPRLTVVLAHLGLPHLPVPGLMAAYERIATHAGVYMDTSMIPSAEVMFMAIHAFGPSRIMFGSDQPLNLIRSQVYHHPQKGERIVTQYPYHWLDSQERVAYGHLATDAIQTHWQVLRAIQSAVSQLPPRVQERATHAIFYGNAQRVFGF